MTPIQTIIIIPILAGIILFALPERVKSIKAGFALMVSAVVLYSSIQIYFSGIAEESVSLLGPGRENVSGWENLGFDLHNLFLCRIDGLSKLITLFIGFFTLLILIYSLVYVKREKKYYNYYPYILLTLGASNGAALADHLILFITFWGFLGLTLYIKGYDEESAHVAKKTLILVGGADALMIFGIGIIWSINGSLTISDLNLSTNNTLGVIAFLTLLIGSFTKAGAFPFHSWVPDYAKKAPASSSAYLPASLDKLLGIYFMARLCNEMFVLNQWLTLIILIIGVSTIIIAVMMALIQHNYKKLLGYHAVSQVGYMVTGLGLGTPLGIIGGLFHMVNHALYKSGLFLAAGSVKEQTGKDDLEELAGLSGKMPMTFITALIFALSISGIPPFNGFASKWIIYQGIIEFGKDAGIANSLWMVWLALAVIGSALTLASFIKFISGIFLGRKRTGFDQLKESKISMLIPMIIIAAFCVGFGVFATNYVVPFLFKPVVGNVAYAGNWSSVTVSLLVIISILLGIGFYVISDVKKFRREDSFIGGETFQESTGFEVTGFYETIREFKLFSGIYKKAEQKWFDIYYLSRDGTLWLNKLLSKAHTGILQTYAIWLVVGLIIMLLFLT